MSRGAQLRSLERKAGIALNMSGVSAEEMHHLRDVLVSWSYVYRGFPMFSRAKRKGLKPKRDMVPEELADFWESLWKEARSLGDEEILARCAELPQARIRDRTPSVSEILETFKRPIPKERKPGAPRGGEELYAAVEKDEKGQTDLMGVLIYEYFLGEAMKAVPPDEEEVSHRLGLLKAARIRYERNETKRLQPVGE